MGEPVVPLILMELGRQPRVSWFVVLTGITGENPVPPALAGQVDATARAWIDWGATTGVCGVSAELEGAFPNFAADGYTVASPKTQAYYPGNQDPHKSLQRIRSSNSQLRLPRDQRSTTESTEITRKRESESTSPFRVLPGGNSRP